MTAYLYRMGVGIPGDVNRVDSGMTIEAQAADPLDPIPAYGVPVVMNAAGSGVGPVDAADAAADLYGVLVRTFPGQSNPPNAFGAQQLLTDTSVPPTQGTLDVLRRGYIAVKLNTGSPAPLKGQPAFVWVAATAAGHVQGQFEAAASGGNTVAAPATFMGPADANGVTEIAWNL